MSRGCPARSSGSSRVPGLSPCTLGILGSKVPRPKANDRTADPGVTRLHGGLCRQPMPGPHASSTLIVWHLRPRGRRLLFTFWTRSITVSSNRASDEEGFFGEPRRQDTSCLCPLSPRSSGYACPVCFRQPAACRSGVRGMRTPCACVNSREGSPGRPGRGRASGELVPPDAFRVRLRGYVSRSVRTFPSRPPKEPS